MMPVKHLAQGQMAALGRVLIFHVYRYPLARVRTYHHTASTTKCPLCLGIVRSRGGHLPLPSPGFWNLGVTILIPVNKELFGSQTELLF